MLSVRRSESGLMLQMDGSTHHRFVGIKSCLIANIDDMLRVKFMRHIGARCFINRVNIYRLFVHIKDVNILAHCWLITRNSCDLYESHIQFHFALPQ